MINTIIVIQDKVFDKCSQEYCGLLRLQDLATDWKNEITEESKDRFLQSGLPNYT